MKRVVERGRMEFQQHIGSGTHDIRDRVPTTQSNQHGVCRQRSVVHRQVVLDHVALVPNSEIITRNALLNTPEHRTTNVNVIIFAYSVTIFRYLYLEAGLITFLPDFNSDQLKF